MNLGFLFQRRLHSINSELPERESMGDEAWQYNDLRAGYSVRSVKAQTQVWSAFEEGKVEKEYYRVTSCGIWF